MSYPVVRLQQSDEIQRATLFEPSVVVARFRAVVCPIEENIDDMEAWLTDYLDLRIMSNGRYFESSPANGWVNIFEGRAADELNQASLGSSGYEVIDYVLVRNPDSNNVWDITVRLQLVEDIPHRGHSLVTRTTRQRPAQAWRLKPFAENSPDPSTFWTAVDSEGNEKIVPLVCNEIDGERCDVNGQPITVMLDQHATTISFVVRAPYNVAGNITGEGNGTAWHYWTKGDGARSLNSRNSADWNGWPAYSLLIDSIEINQIGTTSFHRVDLTMVWDQWWHLEQIPVTYNGAMPVTISVCEGKVFQTEKSLWMNPFCEVTNFATLMDKIPYSARDYVDAATGSWYETP